MFENLEGMREQKGSGIHALICVIFVSLLLSIPGIMMPAKAWATIGTDDYPDKYSDMGHYDSYRLFYYRQCTDFCAWRLNNDNGVAFTNWYGGVRWGNASNWISAAVSIGVTVDDTPAVGAVGCTTAGAYGHVVYCYGISGSDVNIEEYNYGYPEGQYHQRTVNASAFKWIHFKDLQQTLPSSGAAEVSVDAGVYTLISKTNGKSVLDITGANKDNGANAELWEYNGGEAQRFNIGWSSDIGGYWISQVNSGKFLDTEGNSCVAGANVFQWEGTGAGGQNWRFEDAGDGWVYIRSLNGLYLDVDNGGTANGTNVLAWSFNGGENQKFKLTKTSDSATVSYDRNIYTLISKTNGRSVVDITGISKDDGANAELYSYNGSEAQRFDVAWDGVMGGSIISQVGSSKELDISGNSYNSGANVQQWGMTDAAGQRWTFQDAGDGWVYIRSLSGLYLDAAGGGSADGTNLQAYAFNGSDAQKFRISPTSNSEPVSVAAGSYNIVAKVDESKAVDIASASKDNGANVQLYSRNGSESQKFNIGWDSVSSAYYITQDGSGKFIDVDGSSYNAGANVVQWEWNSSQGQRWIFQDAGDGWFYIRSLSGLYLDVKNGETADGTNIQAWTYSNGADLQKFKLVQPSTSSQTVHTHQWGDWQTTKPASCKETGTKMRTCSVCGDSQTEEVPSTAHTPVALGAVAATCTSTGLTEGSKCKVCGVILVAQQSVPALGHDWGEWTVTKGATALREGVEKRVCSRDASHVETRAIPKVTTAKSSFLDVQQDAWYYDVASRAASLGLIEGYGDGTFGPENTLTRAQAATILWRYYEPEAANAYDASSAVNTTGMPDVDGGQWYTSAANWAVSSGVISGKGDGADRSFDPDGTITREQLCAVVANASAKYAGSKVDGADRTMFDAVSDAVAVDSWAADSVAWGLSSGVISGKESRGYRLIDPLGQVTRAEMAAVLMNAIDGGLLGD